MIRCFFRAMFFSLLIIIFEIAIVTNFSFLPALPDFLMIYIVFLSFINTEKLTFPVAFLSGLLFDCISLSPLGSTSAFLLVIVLFASSVREILSLKFFLVPILSMFFSFIVKFFIFKFMSILFLKTVSEYNIFSMTFIFELLSTSLLAPFLFKFFSIFSSFLKYPERIEKNA